MIEKLGTICTRKNNCCRHGSGYLIKSDFEKIAKFLNISVEELKEKHLEKKIVLNKEMYKPKLKVPGPFGECSFFTGEGCGVNEVKPYQCKIGNCSIYGEELITWFMLNNILDKDDPQSLREYAVFLKSGGKLISGGELENLIPDKNLREKILNYDILR